MKCSWLHEHVITRYKFQASAALWGNLKATYSLSLYFLNNSMDAGDKADNNYDTKLAPRLSPF